jgi:hypothetical protein
MLINEAFRKQYFMKGIASFPLTRWKIYLLAKSPDRKLFKRLPNKREILMMASFDMVLDVKTFTMSIKKPIHFPRNNKRKPFTIRAALVTSRTGKYQFVVSADRTLGELSLPPFIDFPKTKTTIDKFTITAPRAS